ncbi:hypothetical protein VTL71DRAFT_756 [Oculimacula yallundae]|uniref:Uncharacterized protein n=1 Tax=Oculimacula yallundae TaxID=86028 RepID=A0ABR4D0X9_9HELO
MKQHAHQEQRSQEDSSRMPWFIVQNLDERKTRKVHSILFKLYPANTVVAQASNNRARSKRMGGWMDGYGVKVKTGPKPQGRMYAREDVHRLVASRLYVYKARGEELTKKKCAERYRLEMSNIHPLDLIERFPHLIKWLVLTCHQLAQSALLHLLY